MGNTSSNLSNTAKYELIEKVAVNYATTLNIENISSLTSSNNYQEQCKNLTFISSELLQKHLTSVEVGLLESRVKNGVDPNTNTIKYLTDADLEKIKVLSPEGKTAACNTISSFYIKIAHLYAAIVRVLQPEITFTQNSLTSTIGLLEALKEKKDLKGKISIENTTISLCSKRVAFLNPLGDHEYAETQQTFNNNTLFHSLSQKNVCGINLKSDGTKKITLGDEYGIYELEQLYYEKDQYGRLSVPVSTSTKYQDYLNTLFKLYETFTLNTEIERSTFSAKSQNEKLQDLETKNIKLFSQIPLKDYTVLCNNIEDPNKYKPEIVKPESTTSNITDSIGDTLFKSNDLVAKQYIEHLKNMHQEKETQIQEILNILNEIFQKGSDGSIIINPALSTDREVRLDAIIEKTRDMIKNLYINCELKYLAGIEKFKQIKEYVRHTQKELTGI